MLLSNFYYILMFLVMLQERQIFSLAYFFKFLRISKWPFIIVYYSYCESILVCSFLHFLDYLIAAMFMTYLRIQQ